jgi:hypothetical protein
MTKAEWGRRDRADHPNGVYAEAFPGRESDFGFADNFESEGSALTGR